MMKIDSLKQSWQQYRRVLSYLLGYYAQFAVALGCMTVYGASDGALPFLVKYALDEVFALRHVEYLYFFPIFLVGLSLLRALADFGQQFLMTRLGHLMVRDIRNQMNRHILKLGPSYFVRVSSGDIMARITSDVQLVRMVLTDSVAAIIRDMIRIVVLLLSAVYLDSTLALLAFIALPVGAVPVYKFGRRLRKLSKRGQDAVGELGSLMNEVIVGQKVVKIFAAEDYEHERFKRENDRLTATFVKSEKVRALTGPVNEVLASLGIAGVILYGGFSVIHQTRTQGEFIAFLMAVFLLYDPFKKLSRVSNTVQQGMAGATRIFELLDTKVAVESPKEPKGLPQNVGAIEFEEVSLGYAGSSERALSGINLKILEGEKVALVGFSGAGKSTLVDLIPRFLDPSEGTVRIGGEDIRNLSLSDLRSRITMVTQHTFLFNDTIKNNILYGNRLATDEEIEQVIDGAYAREFIDKLPKGLDTVIGEGGYSLSGGERQRLAIARAMLKNAPILILDEATASLDNRAERMVQKAIERLEENRTSVVIAHRLSTIQGVDRILVMKNGKIVEQGTHEDLIDRGEEYFTLYSYQFGEKES
jgi:subfamily B ATP-binding cassette protein MsbA